PSTGSRRRRRSGQGAQDGRQGRPVGRRTGNRKDGARARDQPGARHQDPLLPHCRQRDLLDRSEEDGDLDGELQEGHWAQGPRNKGGLRGRGDGADAGGGREPPRRLRQDHQHPAHRPQERQGTEEAAPRPQHIRGHPEGA
ncbi:hypothetical protein BN1708_019284, partial [Verticillium longisporum]